MEYREDSRAPHEGATEFISLDTHKGAGESSGSLPGNKRAALKSWKGLAVTVVTASVHNLAAFRDAAVKRRPLGGCGLSSIRTFILIGAFVWLSAPSRRSDLQSLAYCMLRWHAGTLPWSGLAVPDKVAEEKQR